jgi:hypothetical protein
MRSQCSPLTDWEVAGAGLGGKRRLHQGRYSPLLRVTKEHEKGGGVRGEAGEGLAVRQGRAGGGRHGMAPAHSAVSAEPAEE